MLLDDSSSWNYIASGKESTKDSLHTVFEQSFRLLPSATRGYVSLTKALRCPNDIGLSSNTDGLPLLSTFLTARFVNTSLSESVRLHFTANRALLEQSEEEDQMLATMIPRGIVAGADARHHYRCRLLSRACIHLPHAAYMPHMFVCAPSRHIVYEPVSAKRGMRASCGVC